MSDVKVSVSLITYNHEKYIRDCLKSILSQKADFKFEVVVSNDCSTDGTAKIIDEYAELYPGILRVIHRSYNLGIARNAMETIRQCNGQYIALMEGDDIWIDEGKLQAQSSFLDNNQDCVLCFTNQLIFQELDSDQGKVFFNKDNKPPDKFDLNYFLEHNITIPNNTKMFRSNSFSDIPVWLYDSFQWDWALHIIQGTSGNYGYLDRMSLGYRRHPQAMVSASNNIRLAESGIMTLKGLNKYFNLRFERRFNRLSWHYNLLAFAYLQKRKLGSFVYYYIVSLLKIKSLNELTLRNDLWKIKKFFKKSGQVLSPKTTHPV